MLTTFQFPDGDAILEGALGMKDALVDLKARAREAHVPVLYVNDNFGDWRSVLLLHLQVETLILTGLTSVSCITVTAHDANMRGFDIYIPPDCSCARNRQEHKQALRQLEAMAGADLALSTELKLPGLVRAAQSSKGVDGPR